VASVDGSFYHVADLGFDALADDKTKEVCIEGHGTESTLGSDDSDLST
jgi:hypothetical protein